jgi:hypothetical protein
MKYIYTLLSMAILSFVIISINPQTGHSNSTGAPSGNTGSPSDDFTCAQVGCHQGTPTPKADLITTDIPASGYVPGTDYTITAQVSEAGIQRFGFQVSPQVQNGNTGGALAAIDGNTQVLANRYITHTFTGTSGSSTKSWTFKWTAPAAGTGPVTFYGAFVAANNNGQSDADDKVFTSNLSISEAGHLSAKTLAQTGMSVYPIPFVSTVTINKGHQSFETATVKLFTLDGKLVAQTEMTGETAQLNTENLAKGVYILNIEAANLHVVQKVVK